MFTNATDTTEASESTAMLNELTTESSMTMKITEKKNNTTEPTRTTEISTVAKETNEEAQEDVSTEDSNASTSQRASSSKKIEGKFDITLAISGK